MCRPWYIYFFYLASIFHFHHLPFAQFLEYLPLFLDDNIDEESELFSKTKSSTSGCCLVFA